VIKVEIARQTAKRNSHDPALDRATLSYGQRRLSFSASKRI
jgi:hypothetical protein